ncbi:hypothetical protein RJ639_018626 [Escallonia herrerae]|uniref:SAP domain-containing protein n=1 Tax=Escallonia herrerae TaxID=1293975 RepID=A0AA88V7U3_9ASTE|nr:hypothetical protein RJ639_018626 [Escallonia herrerae]
MHAIVVVARSNEGTLLVVAIVVASRMIDSKICQLVVAVMKDGTRVYVVETAIVGVEAVVGATTVSQLSRGVQDVAELLGMMVEDYTRVQPNVKTYALLVECFTKYCVVREAIRHFRALKNYTGGTVVLHSEGKHGDPLSLYLRALCREGRIVELLEALEAIAKDNQPLPPRAMITSRKYRTLVSSWIEPLQEEAELGYEIDYMARYVAEGGLTGDRKRWVPRRGKTPLDPDALGFIYSNPMETSFKQRCLEDWKSHHRKLLKILRNEGLSAMGDASEFDYIRVEERLKKIIKGPDQNALKPKAASKMVVSELKEELEAQGLPTDGTRNVLYQRVQKARRINRSRGRPLWVPPVEEEEEEVDEELDELLSRIKLEEGNTDFWRRRFLGEGLNSDHGKQTDVIEVEADGADDGDIVEDVLKEVDDEEVDEEEEEVEQSESPAGDRVKDKEVEAAKPLQMIGVQLLKDSDQTNATSRKTRRKVSRISMEDDVDDDWFPEDIYEAFKELRNRKAFDVSDMYTIADAWGWTWEREIKNKPPRRWSQEWEVELAVKLMLKIARQPKVAAFGKEIPALKLFERSLEFNMVLRHCSSDPRVGFEIQLCRQASYAIRRTKFVVSVFGGDLWFGGAYAVLVLTLLLCRFSIAADVVSWVIELGGSPTIGDCAMILRAAIKAPAPSAFLTILQTTHSLGYVFGSPLYDEVIILCLDIGELDAAVAIVADLESTGIIVPDQTLDRVISARQIADSSVNGAS